MKRKTRKLLRENNEFEKTLNDRNQKALTDIVVYLRGCNISEYHQEEVRADIMRMVADGEARNENIEVIIGEDFKLFCDEIVNVFPPQSKKEKILITVSEAFSLTGVMLVIWLMSGMIDGILNKTMVWELSLTLGDVINGLIIVIIANLIVNYTCKTSLSLTQIKARYRNWFYLIAWIMLFLIFGAIYLIGRFLTFKLVSIPIIIATLIIAGLFVISRLIDTIPIG